MNEPQSSSFHGQPRVSPVDVQSPGSIQGKPNVRKPYHSPRLDVYGSVVQLTHLGGTVGNEGNGVFAFRLA